MARSLHRHVRQQDAEATVIAMIEGPEALDRVEAIAATEGLDGVFVGRADLTVAMNETSLEAAAVQAATEKIVAAAAHCRPASWHRHLQTGSVTAP
jgi:2-keto-3-deoxy-L-rhamnonate aldolase RhmA